MQANYKLLNPQNWKRKNQFNFFKDFDHPFFNITANVDVTEAVYFCKANNKSFFLTNLYLALSALNNIEEFRMRIDGENIRIYNHIDAGSTLLYDDDTFGFGVFPYKETLEKFIQSGEQIIEQHTKEKTFEPKHEKEDVVHCSILPWINFTSISHARNFNTNDSIPKLVFGQYQLTNNRFLMPIAVDVHHALMDGFHVSQFFKIYQKYLNEISQNSKTKV